MGQGNADAVSTGMSEGPAGVVACLYSNLCGSGSASPPRSPVKTMDFGSFPQSFQEDA